MPSDCKNWEGMVNSFGYGHGTVHRIIYTFVHGKIPEGYEVHHTCHNRRCFNPEHLVAVKHRDHIEGPCKVNAERTHCINGHPFNDTNTYRFKRKGRRYDSRRCKICMAAYMKNWAIRKNKKRALPSLF